MENPPVVHERFGIGLVAPVIPFVAQGDGEPRGHVDEQVPDIIGPPGIQHQYPVFGRCTQSVGQCAAG